MKETNETADKLNNSIMIRIASFIVDKRILFFLIYIIAILFSAVSQGWVKTENDLAYYLADGTETRDGLDLMEDEFVTFGTAKIMVANITFADADALCDRIENMDGVSSVTFTEEEDKESDFIKHYNNGNAMYDVTFSYDEDDDRSLEALENLKAALSDYDIYVNTSLGDQDAESLAEEMQTIIVLVAIVVMVVLLITTDSYAEIPVLGLTFLAAMILNQGSNFLFGTISFISGSVSSILQLALSVDYAIIFSNHYKEQRRMGLEVRDATVVSLSKSIVEILASSLTTISGLAAMIFMQYKIGADMGIVLIKSILLSLLSAFTLMPGLLVLFSGLMEKTTHRSFIPKISAIGRFDWNVRKIIPPIFLVFALICGYFSQLCPYAYGMTNITAPLENENQKAQRLIEENFGETNFVAIVVPGHDYTKEKQLIDQLETREEVDYCTGLANTEADDGYTLTQYLTPRQFSELIGMDFELCETIYAAYAAEEEEYGRIIGGVSSYKVPLMDMFEFVYEKVDEGYVNLDNETYQDLKDADKAIVDGRKQLEGENYDRILVYLNLPVESDETYDFIETMRTMGKNLYEDDGRVYVVGDSTSCQDLKDSFARDNVVVSVLSILFVLIILLFTFMSAGMPILLIAVIEGSIFINFSVPYFINDPLFFLGYLIVSSIQMGANIDYAIVISTRYQENRETMGRKESIVDALNFAFPTIVTSGSMMILAGVFISQLTSSPAICDIGECLARGTSISVVLVMFVLPEILLIGDTIISKTSFSVSHRLKTGEASGGTIVVNGMIRGQVNGTVVGMMNAVVRGDVRAVIVSGSMEKQDEDGTKTPIETKLLTQHAADQEDADYAADDEEFYDDDDEPESAGASDDGIDEITLDDMRRGGKGHE